MNKIKFCGIRNIDGVMMYGNLLLDDNGFAFIQAGNGWHEVARDSVGQFTGLYDATKFDELSILEQGTFLKYGNKVSDWHGKEIYEHNVLAYNNTVFGFVYFDEERAAFMIDTSIQPFGGIGKRDLHANAATCKVIDVTYKHLCEESKPGINTFDTQLAKCKDKLQRLYGLAPYDDATNYSKNDSNVEDAIYRQFPKSMIDRAKLDLGIK